MLHFPYIEFSDRFCVNFQKSEGLDLESFLNFDKVLKLSCKQGSLLLLWEYEGSLKDPYTTNRK